MNEKSYEVWSEGYMATGESAGASNHGTFTASSFREACDKCFRGERTYDSKSLTLWGCRLFDNEGDAREFFG